MIVAGIGCSSRATAPEIRALLAQLAAGQGLDALVCLQARAAALGPVAQGLGLPLVALAPEAIRGVTTPSQSPRIAACFGTGSVAEACALRAAGRKARIIAARQVSPQGQATCALAQGEGP